MTKKLHIIGQGARSQAVAAVVKRAIPEKSPKAVALVNDLHGVKSSLLLHAADFAPNDAAKEMDAVDRAIKVIDDIDAAFAHAFEEGFDAAVQMLSGHHANLTHPTYIAQRTQEREDWQERNRKS